MGAREETIILYNFGRKVPGLWSDFSHMLISELITPARDGHTDWPGLSYELTPRKGDLLPDEGGGLL